MKHRCVLSSGLVVSGVVTLLFLAGCGGSASQPITVPAVTVSVTPAPATVLAENTQSFTATVQNTSNVGVTWTLSGMGCTGAACGTLSSTTTNPVTYTAPGPPTGTYEPNTRNVGDIWRFKRAALAGPRLNVVQAQAEAINHQIAVDAIILVWKP
jgi:hypothetical protein